MEQDIQIIYEDNDYVAINKPAGLVVHADGKTVERTVADWVLATYPETKGVGEPIVIKNGLTIDRPGIVHRIDRETSGVLVIAKNAQAHAELKLQFQNRTVKKTYHAFVYGKMSEEDGTIDRPIGRSTKDFRLWSAQRGARGEMRDAVTHYKVLKASPDFSYVEVNPKTGRTHQIRVHFKAINHPIVADALYAPNREKALGFNRVALHALSIEFKTLDNKIVSVKAPLPEDFESALKEIEKAQNLRN